MQTQLSAHSVTQKLMKNGVKKRLVLIQKIQYNSKIKNQTIGAFYLTKNAPHNHTHPYVITEYNC